jgi:hypothetical protein
VHIFVVAVSLSSGLRAAESADDLRVRYDQLQTRWLQQAEQLAARYEEQGDAEAAEAIRGVIAPAPDRPFVFRLLPASPSAAAGTAGPDRPQWQVNWTRLRKQHANELFDLARAAFRVSDISLCYDLLRGVIEHDPDHGPARALLGYTRVRTDWVTSFAAGKLRAGFIWHDQFGWIPKAHLTRYEKGEQLWKGQWLAAEEVAKFRQNWSNAWEVDTDHYIVRTNVSLERGVQLATRLEKLYEVFFRLFAGFFSPRDQLAMLLDPPNRRSALGKIPEPAQRSPKKFRVHFYQSREEFLEAIRPYVKSGLDVTTGMYLTGTRVAYFYETDTADDSTVIHEATHQLFAETREHRHGDGCRGNFWVLEGIACYMESFRENADHVELGSWDTARLKRARQRLPNFMPVKELIELDRKDFDSDNVKTLYAESACLSHFLMHYDNGRYRDILVSYLQEVYLGQANYQTLADLLGIDYDTLDRQFREHVALGKDP